ncbi:GIY-YIG nuclease family protein [uncultured Planktosalinus sp.]|uniref:GIY-YIG nuclease family protein n=1 Tax=uncultured Planktosalinus sp. TaxID=1810935 RepID=UPI0030DD2C1A
MIKYIGYSSSLIQRFNSHNTFSNKGYTVKFRPWIVVYVEFFSTKKEAINKEKFLKSRIVRNFISEKILPFYKKQIEDSYPPEADGVSVRAYKQDLPLSTKKPLNQRIFINYLLIIHTNSTF